MSEFELHKGDKVKVVIEGIVTFTDDPDDEEGWFTVENSEGDRIEIPFTTEEIQVTERKFTVFGPGQVVRTKPQKTVFGGRECPRYTYTLGDKGYVSHRDGLFRAYGIVADKGSFTSEHYDLIEVGD